MAFTGLGPPRTIWWPLQLFQFVQGRWVCWFVVVQVDEPADDDKARTRSRRRGDSQDSTPESQAS